MPIAIVLWTLLWGQRPSIFAETPAAQHEAVRHLADKVLEAIRNKDARFLSELVDPAGIGLGFDQDPVSAAQFKKELAEKRGAFCVLFDYPCRRGGVLISPTGSSLRHLLMAQPVTIRTVSLVRRRDQK